MSAVKKKQYLIWKLSLPKIVQQGDGVLLFYDAGADRPVISLRENNLSLAGERLSHADCIAFQQLRLMQADEAADPSQPSLPEAAALMQEAILFEFDFKTGRKLGKQFLLANPDPDAEKNSVSPGDPSRRYPRQRRMVPISVDRLKETLFLYGFDIQWNNDAQPVHYVRFASSASMTRNGQQFFVREDREKALSERVTMGLMKDGRLQWKDAKPNFYVSKWSAYKGLALSDGWDMDALAESARKPLPELTADSVLIVPDLELTAPQGGELPGVSDVSAVTFESPELVAWEEAKEEEKANQEAEIPDPGPLSLRQKEVCSVRRAVSKLTLTDGVGLIDPEFAGQLNKLLGGKPDADKPDRYVGSSGQFHSFQIRMPFMKGVVHSVDFKAFLRERGVDSLRGIDGRVRDLDGIVMILPQSMFKAYKWLMLMKGKEECVDWYFQQYEAFKHHFFVSQKNRPAEKESRIFLNYQVLHTSGIRWADMEALVNESLVGLDGLAKDREARLDYLLSSFESEEPESEDEENTDEWEGPAFSEDEEEGPDTTDDTPDDGKTSVDNGEEADDTPDDGETSADNGEEADDAADGFPAISLQQAILRQPYLAECSAQCRESVKKHRCSQLYKELLHGKVQVGGTGGYLCCDLMQYLEFLVSRSPDAQEIRIPVPRDPIPVGSFYAPGYSAGGLCALFRNPHYSANEHLLLSPMNAADTQREKYLGHLTGVVMLPYENMGAMRLGGADFDGDHVNVTANDTYVSAVKKLLGFSEEKAEGWCGSSLPVIIIPDLDCGGGTSPQLLHGKEQPSILQIREWEAFSRSMDSKIGRLSFTAFRKAAYDDPDTAIFTALGGCEIDSVKKGYTMAEPEYDLPVSPFLKIIKHKKLQKGEDQKITNLRKALAGFFSDGDMGAAQTPAEANCRCNLDYLPVYLYQKQANMRMSWCGGQKLEYARFFDLPEASMSEGKKPQDCRKALADICQAHANRRKRLKPGYVEPPVSSYQDRVLIQILFPRYGDPELTDSLVNSCKAYSDEMYSGQDGGKAEFLKRILDRLNGFELTKEPDRRDLLLAEALSEVTPKQYLDEQVKPELKNFQNDGFALAYRLLRLAEKQQKHENRFNDCKTEAELDVRFPEEIVKVCEDAFRYEGTPDREELVAAALIRLIRPGKDITLERLLWDHYGEAAGRLLRKQPVEGGDIQ